MNNYSMFNMMGMGYPYMGTDCYGKQPSFGETLAQGLVYSFANTGMGVINSIFNGMFSGLGCFSGAICGGGGSGSSAGAARSQTSANPRATADIQADIESKAIALGLPVNSSKTDVDSAKKSRLANLDAAVDNANTAYTDLINKGFDASAYENTDGNIDYTKTVDGKTYAQALAAHNQQVADAKKAVEDAKATRDAEKAKFDELLALFDELEAAKHENKELLEDLCLKPERTMALITADNKIAIEDSEVSSMSVREVRSLITFYMQHNASEGDNNADAAIRTFFTKNADYFSPRVKRELGDAIRLIANDNQDCYSHKFGS